MNILNSSLSASTDGYDFHDDNVSKFLCKDPHEVIFILFVLLLDILTMV